MRHPYPVEYRSEPSNGRHLVHRYENGRQASAPMSFSSGKDAQRVARELNHAVTAGIRLAQEAVLEGTASEGTELHQGCRKEAVEVIHRHFGP